VPVWVSVVATGVSCTGDRPCGSASGTCAHSVSHQHVVHLENGAGQCVHAPACLLACSGFWQRLLLPAITPAIAQLHASFLAASPILTSYNCPAVIGHTCLELHPDLNSRYCPLPPRVPARPSSSPPARRTRFQQSALVLVANTTLVVSNCVLLVTPPAYTCGTQAQTVAAPQHPQDLLASPAVSSTAAWPASTAAHPLAPFAAAPQTYCLGTA
jgi:hypothetical protein